MAEREKVRDDSRNCPRCARTLALSAFGTRVKKGKQSPQPYCRECMVAYHAAWRQSASGKAKFTVAENASRARHPERRAARLAVAEAIRTKRLTRGPCERAGDDCRGGVEAHHDDYAQPLAVRWVCKRHHAQLDRERAGICAPSLLCAPYAAGGMGDA